MTNFRSNPNIGILLGRKDVPISEQVWIRRHYLNLKPKPTSFFRFMGVSWSSLWMSIMEALESTWSSKLQSTFISDKVSNFP